MIRTEAKIEDLTLNIHEKIHVRAPLDVTFEALLEQLAPHNERGDGTPMAMKVEAWPGGRWYRDLGDNNGHFWGNVQAIKRPTLLEISRAPLHVISLRVERAIPLERGRGRNADEVPPHGAGANSRPNQKCAVGLGEHAREAEGAGGGVSRSKSRCLRGVRP